MDVPDCAVVAVWVPESSGSVQDLRSLGILALLTAVPGLAQETLHGRPSASPPPMDTCWSHWRTRQNGPNQKHSVLFQPY